jgi:hypothetical protein
MARKPKKVSLDDRRRLALRRLMGTADFRLFLRWLEEESGARDDVDIFAPVTSDGALRAVMGRRSIGIFFRTEAEETAPGDFLTSIREGQQERGLHAAEAVRERELTEGGAERPEEKTRG